MRSDSVEEGKKYAITTLYFDYASDRRGLQKETHTYFWYIIALPQMQIYKKVICYPSGLFGKPHRVEGKKTWQIMLNLTFEQAAFTWECGMPLLLSYESNQEIALKFRRIASVPH